MASFTERVLILCKTYPSPSAKYAETSCVAGMTENGRLIRLYPVPFRLVSDDQQFKKWQWITARFEKARDDHRPESHRVFVDTIACDADPLPAGKQGWPHRAELLALAAASHSGEDFHVVKSVIEYKAPVRFDWELDIGARVARIGNSSLTFELAIFSKGGNEALVTGEIVWVNTNQQTHRPVPIPKSTRDLIAAREKHIGV